MWNSIQGYALLLNTLATEKRKKEGEGRKGERKRRRKKEQREVGEAMWQN